MGGWTLARGKQAEQTLGDVVTAGATSIALAGADGIFSLGELLFISESGGEETEFLGGVTQVDATSVDFALALIQSKDSGAKLWRAATSHVSGAESARPVTRRVHSGVSLERSLGGVTFAIETAEPWVELAWELEGLTPEREALAVSWLDSATQRGLVAFTLVSPRRAIEAVRLGREPYERIAQAGGRRRLKLRLIVEAEGEYR